MVLLFPTIIIMAIIPAPIHPIIVKNGYLGLAPRTKYPPVLYIVPIIVKDSYLGSIA
jgi:hypothetical protein